jgi:hypothetical protein
VNVVGSESEEAKVNEEDDNKQPTLDTFYQEICNNYRAIDDLRMRLMGLFSIASGVGIAVLAKDPGLFSGSDGQTGSNEQVGYLLVPIGLFGFLVTFGLFLFELRGMQRCAALIKAGEDIERRAGVKGSFLSTPDPVDIFRLRPQKESEHYLSIAASARGTGRVIYPTVLAAWVFVFVIKIFGVIVAGAIALGFFFILSLWLSPQFLRKFDEQLRSDDKTV